MKAVFTVKISNAIASNGFQWQHNGNNIESEEHAMMRTLTVVNAAEMDEGNYACIVTFSSFEGSITSNTAQLLVCKLIIYYLIIIFMPFFLTVSPANITTHPYDQIVAQGGTAEFSVNASGDGLIYQWQRNDANISDNHTKYEGVSTAVLTINDAEVDDAGIYKCIVFNEAGDNVTSNEAILTVSKSAYVMPLQYLCVKISIFFM